MTHRKLAIAGVLAGSVLVGGCASSDKVNARYATEYRVPHHYEVLVETTVCTNINKNETSGNNVDCKTKSHLRTCPAAVAFTSDLDHWMPFVSDLEKGLYKTLRHGYDIETNLASNLCKGEPSGYVSLTTRITRLDFTGNPESMVRDIVFERSGKNLSLSDFCTNEYVYKSEVQFNHRDYGHARLFAEYMSH